MQKPRVLVDLRHYGTNSLVKRFFRVDLSDLRIIRIPLITFSKLAVVGVVLSYLIFGSALAPIEKGQFSMAAQNVEERQQLEVQLE